jgi:signal transduction histidine kinase/DNA-binding response OmpR family regulator
MPPVDPERVLVLPPTHGDAELSRTILAEAGLVCHVCNDLGELARQLDLGAAALLLTVDVQAASDVHRLVEAVRRQPSWSDVPILMLTGTRTDPAATAWATEQLGNVTMLERPVRVMNLVSALRAAIRERRRQYDLRDQLIQLRLAQEQVKLLNEQLHHDLARLMRLHQVSTRLVQTTHLAGLLHEILDAAIESTHADMGIIQLAEGDQLKIVAQRGFPSSTVARLDRVSYGLASSLLAKHSGRRAIVEDVSTSSIFAGTPAREILLEAGVRSLQSVPLLTRGGDLVGVFSTHYRTPHRLEEWDLRLLDLLSRQAADFIERTQAYEALQEADRRKDEFLATLAHELRNPLAPMRNALHILRLRSHDSGAAEQAHTMMERQLGQMVRLIDDLLDVSRISRGRLELRTERVELGSIIQSALETALPAIESAGHELSLAMSPQPVYLDADPVRVAQILSNLLNNAAKYTDRGGQIWLGVTASDGEVRVTVRDNGIGIPAAALPTLFEMFTQAHRSPERSQGGLGIGLTLVRRLTEMHGGKVTARSAGPGQGAEFTVSLPVASSTRPPRAEGGVGSEDAGKAGPLRYRILVADDNADAAESLGMMLRLMGNEVRIVRDGAQAVQEAAAFRPDVIMLDIGMPQLNGYDAARRIRAQAWGKGVILIALTGWGQEEDKRKAAEAGFDQHFTKPVNPAELERYVAGLQANARRGSQEASR